MDEWWARRRDLYLTTYITLTTNNHDPARFEPTVSAGEGPQTYGLDRATTGIGFTRIRERKFSTPEYFSHSESNFSLRYPRPCFLPSISFCEIVSVITSIRLRDILHLNKGTQHNHANHKNTFKGSDELQQKYHLNVPSTLSIRTLHL